MYIMRRTQLYLPEKLWKALHARSRKRGTTISELVRQAVSEKYSVAPDRQAAMRGLVGLWKDRKGFGDTQRYVRRLRKGKRLERLGS